MKLEFKTFSGKVRIEGPDFDNEIEVAFDNPYNASHTYLTREDAIRLGRAILEAYGEENR